MFGAKGLEAFCAGRLPKIDFGGSLGLGTKLIVVV